MAQGLTLVSIVCPAFQEEEVLPLFHQELGAALDALQDRYRFEIIYVDDGSADGTLAVLKQLARVDHRVRYLSLSRNFGHQVALTAGLEHARGRAVISMDSDLQHPPAVVAQLLEKWREGFEVVITIRAEDRRLGLFKRLTSRVFYRVMALVSDVEIRLAASDFRLLSRRALRALLRLREQQRFVRGLVQWLGFPATEIEFQPDERRAGRSKYTLSRMLRLAGDGFFSFSSAPLRLPLYLGSVVLGVGLVHAAWLAASLVLGNRPDVGRHYPILALHLLGGVMLTSVGIVGEYVGRVYEQVKRRPLYLLKDASPRLTSPRALARRRDLDNREAA